jgi:signal transduction histidine kinase
MNVYLTVIVGVMIVLLMAVFIIVFVVFYQRKQLQQRVNWQVIEESYQSQLLEASLRGQEAERRRIADDLHDDIGTLLSATRLNLAHALRSFQNPGDAEKLVIQSKALLDDAISNVRKLSQSLKPSSLDSFGLSAALEEFAQKMTQRTSVEINFEEKSKMPKLIPAFELTLYRIAQELVGNSLRHANASRINIYLYIQNMKIILIVQDNGIGFNWEFVQQQGKSGYGLKNIESRLRIMNGSFVFGEPDGVGTKTTIIIPLGL